MAKFAITEKFVRERVADAPDAGKTRIFYDDHKNAPPGFGLRVTSGGSAAFVLNYFATGIERRATIGPWPGLSITAARERANKMRATINSGGDPLADKAAHRAAVQAARAEVERKQTQTFGGLLAAYVAHLRAMGKVSAASVEKLLERHIIDAEKKLAAKSAEDVTEDDLMPVLHKLTKAGKYREAEKLRSYLRAAYAAARKARSNASMFSFKGFAIRSNPLAELDTIERPKSNGKPAVPSKWALSEEQLAHYWRHIVADETSHGPLLRFHLLTGGQRVEQLVRLTVDHYDADAGTVTVLDGKGRRREAREHVVPLIADAASALATMRGDGQYLFTVTRGASPVHERTVWEAVNKHAQAMLEAKEVDRLFSSGAIRKTVETRLAAKGVSDEVLARLLSHGLGTVQAKHYNVHHYDDEKRSALLKLRAMLEPKGKAGNVVVMRA